MKPQELTLLANPTSGTQPLWAQSSNEGWDSSLIYRELADCPVQIHDPIEELGKSVLELEDLQARLRFMMREVRQMMKA